MKRITKTYFYSRAMTIKAKLVADQHQTLLV